MNPTGPAALLQDLRDALRVLLRQPRFALLTIATMALGIGATTALFSVTYGVLMKPLPWPDADRLVVLKETRGGKAPRFGTFTNAAYLAWREQAATVEEIAAWSQRVVTLTGAGDPERIRVTSGTASLFRALAARPAIGSLFDDASETAPVVVIAEGLWRTRFGGDPAVLGRTVRLDGEPRTIIGVLPDAAAYPDRQTQAWVPMRIRSASGNFLSMFSAVAKLRPGVSAEQAAAEGTARGRFVANTGMTTMAIFGGDGPVEVSVTPLRHEVTRDVERPLLILLAAVGLLLAIATMNVASLQLARATARRRELALRSALGASPGRVVRQLMAESLMLGVAGGAVGIALAWLLQRALPSLLPSDFPRAVDLALDLPVVLVAAGLSMVASVVFGLFPALRARRLDLVGSLADDGGAPTGVGARTGSARARLAIIGGQVALACVLLVAAMLLGRSFVALLQADRGVDPAHVLTARVSMPAATYTPERRHAIVTALLERASAVGGVRHAAFTSEFPLAVSGSTASFLLPSREASGGTVRVQASPRLVSAGYFEALDLRIVAGRPLAATDTETSAPVVVVNETFARRYLPAAPVGARVPVDFWGQEEGLQATVVGVVEDTRYVAADVTSLAELYVSYRQLKGQLPVPTATLLVRTDGDPRAAAATVRALVRAAGEGLVADGVMTLEDRLLATSLARPRLYAVLLASFAIVALLVTGVGLFGVLSYTVAQRTRELGVRAALGASRAHLVALVLRQGLVVTVGGLVIGLIASAWLARFLASLLYGVTPRDGLTYAVVPVVLFIVAALACLAPARRAALLDPLRALRA